MNHCNLSFAAVLESAVGTNPTPTSAHLGRETGYQASNYSPVSNIGDIRSLEEGSDEGSIVLDADEVGLDTFLEQFV